ncbi:hypothetical protein SAMN04487910_2252 [Aquimarina amphilecti]|uniref:Uncharacterized protein n=1 Tax=Aquimarina amphilecti TaxID=1038014 RepID=A0A1H7PME9_AQUAM|nr:hypothetical protein SAMN04487910_2252 [Aquimarina amphilecti]
MLKNILNLEGVQKLKKTEQKSVRGNGFPPLACGVCEIRLGGTCINVCL